MWFKPALILYDCLNLSACAERDGTQWCPCPRRLEGVERGGGKRRYLAPTPKLPPPAPAELWFADVLKDALARAAKRGAT